MDWSDNVTVAALVGAAAAALLTGVGYLLGRWLRRDRTDLLFDLQELQQAVPLVGAPPRLEGTTVYCESVRMLLVLGHNRLGDTPVLVNRVGIEVEPVPGGGAPNAGRDYDVDVLGLRPRGIVDVRRYEMGIKADDVRGRFIADRSASGAEEINPRNLLERSNGLEGVSLAAAETPIALSIVVQADGPGLYRVRFQVGYTVRGAGRHARTDWIYLYRKA
jgi:hypothetical protein